MVRIPTKLNASLKSKVTQAEFKEKKTWQFWCCWEGGCVDSLKIDTTGLEDDQDITFFEYLDRKKRAKEQR